MSKTKFICDNCGKEVFSEKHPVYNENFVRQNGVFCCDECFGLVAGGKPFFHELPQSTIDQMIKDGKTLQYVMDNYRQPEWCKHPNALEGKMGCWSLIGMRTDISRDFCEDCDCYEK